VTRQSRIKDAVACFNQGFNCAQAVLTTYCAQFGLDRENALKLACGFTNIRMTPKDNSKEIVNSWVPGGNIADFVASYIIEATKPCCCGSGCCC